MGARCGRRCAAAPGARRRLLTLLAAARWLTVLLPGYIHPDEFFQGPEPMAHDVLGLRATIPWEFAEKPPCRSVVSALLTSGIPLLCVRLLGTALQPRHLGSAVLLAPRIWMVALSFIGNLTIDQLCSSFGQRSAAEPALLVFGSAWPCLLMSSRPFSNSMEAALLAAALLVSLGRRPKHSIVGERRSTHSKRGVAVVSGDCCSGAQWRWFGFIGALGLFTRFTFVIFGGVLGCSMIIDASNALLLQRQEATAPATNHGGRTCRLCRGICWWWPLAVNVLGGVAVFSTTSLAIVILDSLYFSTAVITYDGQPWSITPGSALASCVGDATAAAAPGITTIVAAAAQFDLSTAIEEASLFGWSGELTLTPLNSYRYNAKLENLAQHGLHPRWTHAIVNMPMMFGPLTMLGLCTFARLLNSAVHSTFSASSTWRRISTPSKRRLDLQPILGVLVILYLAALSTAPHQEPRFLLPLLLPMSLLFGTGLFPPNRRVGGDKQRQQQQKQQKQQQARRCCVPMLVAWVCFNIVLVLFFGVLHQAGVARSVVDIGAMATPYAVDAAVKAENPGLSCLLWDGNRPLSGERTAKARRQRPIVIYFHTYMPPVALAGFKQTVNLAAEVAGGMSGGLNAVGVRVLDLSSNSSMAALDETVTALLSNPHPKEDSSDNSCVFVVAPGSIDLPRQLIDHRLSAARESDPPIGISEKERWRLGSANDVDRDGLYTSQPQHQWWPHLSMEDPPWEHHRTTGINTLGVSIRELQPALSLAAWRVWEK